MTDLTATKCEHTLLENGIHEFIFHEGSMSGADAFLAGLEALYQSRNATSAPLLVLADSGSVALPISYSMQRGKELSDRYPNIGNMYTATLTARSVEARLADSMVRLMRFPRMRMRFFDQNHREDAIQWLLQQR